MNSAPTSSRWLLAIAAVAAGTTFASILFIARPNFHRAPSKPPLNIDEIPVPFAAANSATLEARLTLIEYRGPIPTPIVLMDFPAMGNQTAPRAEHLNPNIVYLIQVPDDAIRRPLGMILRDANGQQDMTYFGYRYSPNADEEKRNKFLATFKERFPRTFFASKAQRDDPAGRIAEFEQQNQVTFLESGFVPATYNNIYLEPGGLYAFITNNPSGMVFDMDVMTCGNGWKDTNEQCEDGNVLSGDGCSGQCRIETGYLCTGNPSSCTQDISCVSGPYLRQIQQGQMVVDNSDAIGYSDIESLGWHTDQPAYRNTYRYGIRAEGPNSQAVWCVKDLISQQRYQILATWRTTGQAATNAPFSFVGSTGVLGNASVNQHNPPSGVAYNGVQWQNLGSVTLAGTGTFLQVRLAKSGTGEVLADAVWIFPEGGILPSSSASSVSSQGALSSLSSSVSGNSSASSASSGASSSASASSGSQSSASSDSSSAGQTSSDSSSPLSSSTNSSDASSQSSDASQSSDTSNFSSIMSSSASSDSSQPTSQSSSFSSAISSIASSQTTQSSSVSSSQPTQSSSSGGNSSSPVQLGSCTGYAIGIYGSELDTNSNQHVQLDLMLERDGKTYVCRQGAFRKLAPETSISTAPACPRSGQEAIIGTQCNATTGYPDLLIQGPLIVRADCSQQLAFWHQSQQNAGPQYFETVEMYKRNAAIMVPGSQLFEIRNVLTRDIIDGGSTISLIPSTSLSIPALITTNYIRANTNVNACSKTAMFVTPFLRNTGVIQPPLDISPYAPEEEQYHLPLIDWTVQADITAVLTALRAMGYTNFVNQAGQSNTDSDFIISTASRILSLFPGDLQTPSLLRHAQLDTLPPQTGLVVVLDRGVLEGNSKRHAYAIFSATTGAVLAQGTYTSPPPAP